VFEIGAVYFSMRIPRKRSVSGFKDTLGCPYIDSSTIAKTLGVAGYGDFLASSLGGLFGQMQLKLATPAKILVVTLRPQEAGINQTSCRSHSKCGW
jgi:hypothetical protein